MKLDGWQHETGATPSVVSSPNYSGEPSLKSSAASGNQTDYTTQKIIKNLGLLYFQVAMNVSSSSTGYFGLGQSSSVFVAVVGVEGDKVVAGSNLKNLQTVQSLPTSTAYPKGWVDIWGMIINDFDSSSRMLVFVDGTNAISANVSVPSVQNYAGALIETTKGISYYSSVYVTTMFLPSYSPGYNTIEGYGMGCCGVDLPLPSFYNQTATVTLKSWSMPQNNIQSWQINTGNATFLDDNACAGFFQLGFDFNSGGYIAPWYVEGNNCEAQYFDGIGGVATPTGSVLTLSIVWQSSTKHVLFNIVDKTTGKTFSESIAYSGSAFVSALTQFEFESYAKYPIAEYKANLVVSGYEFTKVGSSTPQKMNLSELYPSLVNAPPTWDLTYYNNATAGYQQIST